MWQGRPWSLSALVPARCLPLQNVLCNRVQGPHFGHVCHLYGVFRGGEGRSHSDVRISVRKTTGYYMQVIQTSKMENLPPPQTSAVDREAAGATQTKDKTVTERRQETKAAMETQCRPVD